MSSPKKPTHTYDYPRPALTVDVIALTREPMPRVLLIQRKHDPFAGSWALPGGFVEEHESLKTAALRELREETGVELFDIEQLYTAGDRGRDPRGWTVSVAYLAHVNADTLKPQAADDASAVEWFPLDALPALAFDHAMLLTRAHARQVDRRA